jgi:hypothetical protein
MPTSPALIPSFVAKVSRAKKHLVELEAEVKRFADTHPYTVGERIEGKKQRKTRRLVFTADPANKDIPIIAADVIYNLRSALDHLMSSMVAPKDRGSAMFPIYFQGVWEAIVPGENQQRIKNRMRWASDVKTLPDDAITVLKRLQPPDDPREADEPSFLPLINRLSNRDRHTKLPVVAAGLNSIQATFTEADGTVRTMMGDVLPDYVLNNEAEFLDIPDDAVDVKIRGVPVVGIKMGTERRVEIPDRLGMLIDYIEGSVFPPLMPFVRA